jgi:hypothetical protein
MYSLSISADPLLVELDIEVGRVAIRNVRMRIAPHLVPNVQLCLSQCGQGQMRLSSERTQTKRSVASIEATMS